jgi:hypothetical protein
LPDYASIRFSAAFSEKSARVLEGTVEDCGLLRGAAERLLERCERGFAKSWAESLLPVLDKLAAARRGEEVDSLFWNSMCKLGGQSGSGGSTWFSGWFNIFFPYIGRSANHFCRPYTPELGQMVQRVHVTHGGFGLHGGFGFDDSPQGPDCQAFGSGMSQAPVTWTYHSEELALNFNADFIGATQDPKTLAIAPHVGWFITYADKPLAPSH